MKSKRVDGRTASQLRTVKLTRGVMKFADASCLVEWGDTKVICTATVDESVPPFLRNSGTGWLTAEYGMLPRSSTQRIARESVKGKLSGRTQEIQRLIGRSLRTVVDLAKLGERSIVIDCDVVQADGGTRCASITGAFIAMVDAVRALQKKGLFAKLPVGDFVAAVSVGMVKEQPVLDLNYAEDSKAEVDMNVIMTGGGKFIELQGTAERNPFGDEDLSRMLQLAKAGLKSLVALQKKALGAVSADAL